MLLIAGSRLLSGVDSCTGGGRAGGGVGDALSLVKETASLELWAGVRAYPNQTKLVARAPLALRGAPTGHLRKMRAEIAGLGSDLFISRCSISLLLQWQERDDY